MKNEHDRFQKADRLLDAALDLPANERAAYLDRECGETVTAELVRSRRASGARCRDRPSRAELAHI
jgi:hypothetical protein